MTAWAQMALLVLALFVAGASTKGGGGGGGAGSGPLRPEKDATLNHPALAVSNRSDLVLRLRLEGKVRREVVVPPGEITRTLLAAGAYRFELRRGDRLLGRGVLEVKRGVRYTLEPEP